MITASDLFASIRSFLDDDNSGMYSEVADLSPAVNAAIDYMVAVFTAIFEQDKLSPEVLRELIKVTILDVASTGAIDLSTVSELWTIFGVDPDPVVTGGGTPVLSETRYRWATKLTLEKWGDAANDPFSPGTSQSIPAAFARPAYTGPGQMFGDSKPYLIVRPVSLFNGKAAIWYLEAPTRVTNSASEVPFPQSMHTLLVQKSLNYLAVQQGPESKYGVITDKDIKDILTLFIR